MTLDLAAYAAERGIKYFMISFTDLFGGQRAKLVPAQAIADMQEDGAGFAGFATWLDLTPAFRAAIPQAAVAQSGQGVVLETTKNTQKVVRVSDKKVLLEATPADPLHLADDVVAWLDAHPDHAEPLMFDGAHPDAAGFVVFSEQVAAFLKQQGWR